MVTDDVFAVIAEATRREILVSLRSGDKAVGELVEELAASQPTISKHLKVLREADLVSMRAQGQKRYYTLNPKPLAGVASWLETFDVGPAAPVAVVPSAGEKAAVAAEVAEAPAAAELAAAPQALSPAVTVQAGEAPVSVELQTDDTVPQQIGRTVGRAATKAADLLANLPTLPKFGRKR
ncbi:ArsR/SmtB family transcription factor [Paenarthrobacter ureafaciens]|jgi:DNA-binding transcriptional ArsR family regulator|uniref:ArsR/SmtB family transcription factor n=1 Tax=Paenarthrobacter TaxID=1742992 RepID=UPI001C2BA356|nr:MULTISPECIES: metalloregulator ArsR/SmtB family transcription factor [Paenarthrobacter]MCW3767980.1 metalloregulator ArsR/SmtB family transcription factor [Paenarthrobacter sp. PAE-2]